MGQFSTNIVIGDQILAGQQSRVSCVLRVARIQSPTHDLWPLISQIIKDQVQRGARAIIAIAAVKATTILGRPLGEVPIQVAQVAVCGYLGRAATRGH